MPYIPKCAEFVTSPCSIAHLPDLHSESLIVLTCGINNIRLAKRHIKDSAFAQTHKTS